MIARVWRGWTEAADADAYERFLRTELFPEVARLDGFGGAHILRRPEPDGEVEFVTVTLFDSLDAVREFAGEDYEAAVVPPEARRLLARFEERSTHFEVVVAPGFG